MFDLIVHNVPLCRSVGWHHTLAQRHRIWSETETVSTYFCWTQHFGLYFLFFLGFAVHKFCHMHTSSFQTT